ncbi:2OG-Fe(II) oxygenase [Brevundimonas sp. TWP1-2-1b1]|uniref:2OG-Fe(II) oxygenase n=1 Tax=unclassified Brevundimonas TaxID=2622653 RepID=UPI003CF3B193
MNRTIQLNPRLDPRDYAAAYARDGMVQVPDLLEEASAEWLELALEHDTAWRLSLKTPEGGKLLSPQEMQTLGRDAIGAKMQKALAEGRDGFSFLYLAYPIITTLLTGEDEGHATHALLQFFNDIPFTTFAKAVTGETSVTKIDAQATWFRPGDFLTQHDDTGVGERRAAYTLGLSRDWRPDWGGQLMFHDANGDIERGFKPGFNVWTVFKTPRMHSVAPVAAYAGGKRRSITGWLRDDPPVK